MAGPFGNQLILIVCISIQWVHATTTIITYGVLTWPLMQAQSWHFSLKVTGLILDLTLPLEEKLLWLD